MSETVQVALDLSSCEREPIHIPGQIQPFGALIAARRGDWSIEFVSDNLQNVLKLDPEEALQLTLCDLLTAGALSQLGAITSDEPVSLYYLTFSKERLSIDRSSIFNAIAHLNGELVVLEIEKSETGQPSYQEPHFDSSAVKDIGEYLKNVADGVRAMTGYDRTLIYKFDEHWNGVVAAESKESSLDTWLGLNFPASDIPKQAREIFLLNWIRTIADVNYKPSQIIARPSERKSAPLDLSRSLLRAVSPIHLEYLRNMNVAGSMTISIICNGRLWGLIACHHGLPKYVYPSLRFLCAFLAKTVSYQISLIEQNQLKAAERRIGSLVSELEKSLAKIQLFENAVQSVIKSIKELLPSDGVVIFLNQQIYTSGLVAGPADLTDLHNWLNENVLDQFVTANLASSYGQAASIAATASGILAIKISNGFIVWCRREVLKEIKWAGDPDKAASQEKSDGRLHPRKSFVEWKTFMKHTCASWTNAEIAAAQVLKDTLDRKSTGASTGTSILGKAERQYTEKLLKILREEARNIEDITGAADGAPASNWNRILEQTVGKESENTAC